MRRTGVLFGLATSLLAACPNVAPFLCGDDDDCNRGGAGGRCLADGACAYPDEACDSGLVRSPNAAQDAGECVPVAVGSSSETTDSPPTSSVTTEPPMTGDSGPQPTCGEQVRLEIDTEFLSTTEVLEGYPVLVVIDDATIVGPIAQAGTDPVFVTEDGTALASEIERIEGDVLIAWVRLPAYALGERVPLSLQFGAEIVAGDRAAAWQDRYVGVWHMDEAPTGIDGDEIRNSASPGEPALTVGGMTAEQSVTGAFGRGMQFDGTDDALEIHAGFVGTLDSYTVSMWVRYDDDDGDRGHYFYRLNGDYHYPRCWRFGESQDGDDNVFCQYQLDPGDPVSLFPDAQQATGELVHIAVMRDAASSMHRVFIDGELTGEQADARGAVLRGGDLPMLLGRGEDDYSLDGMIDEVRVSAAPIPATWLRADFRSQIEPTGAVEIVGGIEPIADCGGG